MAESVIPDSDGNLIGSAAGAGTINPALGTLADNGGPTMTHALLDGSPAIDAGDGALAVDSDGVPIAFDQRGAPFTRFNGEIDMGAYEAQRFALVVDSLLDESDGDFSAGT